MSFVFSEMCMQGQTVSRLVLLLLLWAPGILLPKAMQQLCWRGHVLSTREGLLRPQSAQVLLLSKQFNTEGD